MLKISSLRQHCEGLFSNPAVPFHFVAINEGEHRPCATIRKATIEDRQGIDQTKKSGFRVTSVEVEFFADEYETMEDLADQLVEALDGESIQLDGRTVTCLVTDENDDAYPGQDGSDDWIYGRTLTIRFHTKRGN